QDREHHHRRELAQSGLAREGELIEAEEAGCDDGGCQVVDRESADPTTYPGDAAGARRGQAKTFAGVLVHRSSLPMTRNMPETRRTWLRNSPCITCVRLTQPIPDQES